MNGENPRSTAKIMGHPIHPMLVPLPITFFIAAFATDQAFADAEVVEPVVELAACKLAERVLVEGAVRGPMADLVLHRERFGEHEAAGQTGGDQHTALVGVAMDMSAAAMAMMMVVVRHRSPFSFGRRENPPAAVFACRLRRN